MSDDFAVLDFALVALPPRAVVRALADSQDGSPASAPPPRTGWLSRLFGRSPAPEAPARPRQALQPPGTLPEGVIVRQESDDMGFSEADHPMRISAPVGREGLTLIELREPADHQASLRLLALSLMLETRHPGTELLGFRLTGARHPGGEYAFTVYRDRHVARRLATWSPEGLGEDAPWEVTDTGTPHPAEAVLEPGPAPADRLTPAMLASLLEELGVDPDAFLEDRSGYTEVLEISSRPGGIPLHRLTPAQIDAALAARAPAPEPAPAIEMPPDMQPEHPAAPDTAASWEDEVTALLLDAVTDALPEPEQVPWLDALTDELEAGETEAAMARACDLLARGTRPQAVRDAAARRLATLLGVSA